MTTAVMSEAQLRTHYAAARANTMNPPIIRTREKAEEEVRKAMKLVEAARMDTLRALAEVDVLNRTLKRRDVLIKSLKSQLSEKPKLNDSARSIPNVAPIVAVVLHDFPGVTWGDVVSKNTTKPVVEARWRCVMAVRKAYPRLSLPDLGDIFHRHHTSILHLIQKYGAKA